MNKANSTTQQLSASEMVNKGVAADNDGNYQEAVRWYRKAAEQGHAKAQYNLGVMYYNGFGVTQDRTEAKKWWEKSAAQGNQTAINNLKDYFGIVYGN